MIDAAGIDWSKVVFHCFTEGPLEMAELTKRGGFGSFTGVVTYKNAEPVFTWMAMRETSTMAKTNQNSVHCRR